jgi:hypothetical protein
MTYSLIRPLCAGMLIFKYLSAPLLITFILRFFGQNTPISHFLHLQLSKIGLFSMRVSNLVLVPASASDATGPTGEG